MMTWKVVESEEEHTQPINENEDEDSLKDSAFFSLEIPKAVTTTSITTAL